VCIDGKKLRGATPKASPESGIYLLSAWVAENGLCVAQSRVEEKSNEITAIPQILDSLELTDTLVSIDAMGCQKAIANQIVQKEGHYLLALKENQGALYQDVKYAFQTCTPIATVAHTEEDTKADTRICTILDATTCLPEAQLKVWKNINRLIRIESSRTVAAVTNWTTRYYIADEQVNISIRSKRPLEY
jgi:predicted transposase YbfD/YdcC